MSTSQREDSTARPSPKLIFLLINLLGFPVASAVVDLPQHLLSIAGAPVWLVLAPGIGAGLALIGLNFWLCWRARQAGSAGRIVTAMVVWSLLCLVTLVFLGTYSPLNLALAFVTARY